MRGYPATTRLVAFCVGVWVIFLTLGLMDGRPLGESALRALVMPVVLVLVGVALYFYEEWRRER